VGQHQQSLTAALRVTELQPTSIDGWYATATQYRKLGDTVRAIEAYKRVIQLDPTHRFSIRAQGKLKELAGEATD
jgi:predicted TPR repeat methyltransferase